jgi:hypothetical protein
MSRAEMTYEVDNPEIQQKLKEIAGLLHGKLPKGWGFTLLLFEYSPNDSLFYISSANRQQMVNAMREFIKKFGAN